MNTVWKVSDTELTLNRYPKGQHDKSLQAWDSADEYLIEYITPLLAETQPKPALLICNDLFGALTLGLKDCDPCIVTDSYISHLAILQNCRDNELPAPELLNSLTEWPQSDIVLLKLTKNLGFLEYQLQQLAKMPQPCRVVAAGKTTLVTSNVLKLFDKYLSEVSTSLAKKKSRLVFATHTPGRSVYQPKVYPLTVNWPEMNLDIASHANVFAKEQIDIGGRFLAENLPDLEPFEQIVDLGCGNGLLGLACLQQMASKNYSNRIRFTDESYMAVASAELNVSKHFGQTKPLCEFVQDDCLTSIPAQSVDLILCNPPFHQQNTITEHIAKQMFEQSYQCLKPSGQLLVVANRHLPYQGLLKKLFGGFTILAQNRKFVIYQCNKLK